MRISDYTGMKIGRLTVEREADKLPGNKNRRWLCTCECGKKVVVFGYNLATKHTLSCGCAKSEYYINKNTIHGQSHTRLYGIWCKIKDRCYCESCNAYKYYGARGIIMSDEWKNDFVAFYKWAMTNGYREDLSIDRIDNNGCYTPDNCRWTDVETQMNNMSTNRMITVDGITLTQRQWERRICVCRGKLWKIRNSGKSVEEYIKSKMEGKNDK